MGETLDAGGDAQEQCELVFGCRFRGKIFFVLSNHHLLQCLLTMVQRDVELSLCLSLQLFLFLQDFSQRMLSKTHEIEKQLDGLIRDTKATDCCLHTVFNDFLMLSNTQFIENVIFMLFLCKGCTSKLILPEECVWSVKVPMVLIPFFIQRVYDEEIEEPPAKPDVPERQSEQVG